MAADKTWVTNLHTEAQEFELASGGFEMIQPGESKSIALANPGSAKNLGAIHAGLFAVSDKEPKPAAVQPTSSEVAVTKSAEIAKAIQPDPKPPEK